MLIFSHYIIKYHKGVILFLTSQRFLSFLFCFYSLLLSLPFLISSFFSFTSKFLSKTLSRVLETTLKERRSFSKQEAGWQEPSGSAGDLCQLPGQKDPLRRRRLPAPAVLPDTILRTEEPGGLHSEWGHRESDTTQRLNDNYKQKCQQILTLLRNFLQVISYKQQTEDLNPDLI